MRVLPVVSVLMVRAPVFTVPKSVMVNSSPPACPPGRWPHARSCCPVRGARRVRLVPTPVQHREVRTGAGNGYDDATIDGCTN